MNELQDVVVALTADMILAARIRGSAQDVKIILARDVADFLTKVRDLQPRLAVLDLDRHGLDVQHVIHSIKGSGTTKLLAYGAHVREDIMATARAAGADRVLARGAFVRQLPDVLR